MDDEKVGPIMQPAVDQQQEAFEKILDEIVEKYGDTLRRLGDS